MAPGGESLVTWWSSHKEPAGGETGDGGVYGQFYGAAGTSLGSGFRINQTIAGAQEEPSVGVDAGGNFLVTWSSGGSPSLIYGRTFTQAGPTGNEFVVADNPVRAANAVAVDDDGDPVVAWTASDGSNDGIWARRFDQSLPRVTGVFVDSESWSSTFRQYLADHALGDSRFGFAVGGGADQLKVLPWVGLNRISIRFRGEVDADFQDLVVHGVRGGDYALGRVSFDNATHTVTWTLSQPLDADTITLDLDADPPAGVKRWGPGTPDLLDGDWADGADAFPSGDGTPGGDFRFRFNVLPGDVDRSGAVLADDYSAVKRKFFSSTASPGSGAAAYSVFHDVNGSGSVLADDYSEVKKRFFTRLPSPAATALLGIR
jgi:hypothetical protein